MTYQNFYSHDQSTRYFEINHLGKISRSLEIDVTPLQVSENVPENIIFDARPLNKFQEPYATSVTVNNEGQHQMPWESDIDQYAIKSGNVLNSSSYEFGPVDKLRPSTFPFSSNRSQELYHIANDSDDRDLISFVPYQALGYSYNFQQDIKPEFACVQRDEGDIARFNQLLTGSDSVDPLTSSLLYCYLSESSIGSCFDNMTSGCPTLYSSHSSASFDNESVIQIHCQSDYSDHDPRDSYFHSLNKLPLQMAANPRIEKPIFSLGYSPKETHDYVKTESLDVLCLDHVDNIVEAICTETGISSKELENITTDEFTENENHIEDNERKKKEGQMKIRNHKCPVCLKVFKRPLSFRIHYSIHTGEREHQCDWPGCGKLFNVKSNMTRHQKVHLKKQGKRK